MSDLAFTASCAECYRKNQRIVALEKLCQQQHEAVKRWRVHSIWIPAIGYSMGQEADKIIAAYDALFPKTGGAK